MKSNRRYVYLNGTQFKSFTSIKKMREWAEEETHDGKYYVSCPNITFTYSKSQILEVVKFHKTKS